MIKFKILRSGLRIETAPEFHRIILAIIIINIVPSVRDAFPLQLPSLFSFLSINLFPPIYYKNFSTQLQLTADGWPGAGNAIIINTSQ